MIRSNVCSRSVDEGHVYEKFGVPHQRSRVTWVMDHTLSAVILASKLKLAVSQDSRGFHKMRRSTCTQWCKRTYRVFQKCKLFGV